MKLNFFLLNKRKAKTSIQAIIRYRGMRYVISIGESVFSKYWNPKTHRCRLTREYPEASYINLRLDEWQDIIKDISAGNGNFDALPASRGEAEYYRIAGKTISGRIFLYASMDFFLSKIRCFLREFKGRIRPFAGE